MIDKNFKKRMKEVDALRKAAEKGDFKDIPKSYLTFENFKEPDSFGQNILHYATTSCSLNKVPKEFLLEELILGPENGGETVLHLAATHHQIKFIPKELITQKNLLLEDEELNTVYHYLANYGSLNQISKKLITEEIALKPNEFGKDLLDFTIHAETKETNPEIDQTQIILSILSNDSLNKIIKTEKRDKVKISLCQKEIKRRIIFDNIKKEEESIEI